MAYLHYTHESKYLNEWFDRVDRKALANDGRIRSLEEQSGDYKNQFLPVPDDISFTLAECRKRQHNLSAHLDKIAEELDWRENRQFLIDGYAKFGYTLRFVCWGREFATAAEALNEARFQYAYNAVLLSMGPDGSGVDNMLPPERMVQAVFKRSID